MPNTPKRHLRDPEAMTAHGRALPICRSAGRDLTDDRDAVTCGTCQFVIAAMTERAPSAAVVVRSSGLPDLLVRQTATALRKPVTIPTVVVHVRDVLAPSPWRQALCRKSARAFATVPSEVTCGACQRSLAKSIGAVRARPTPPVLSPPRQTMPRTRPESHENRPSRTRHPNTTPVVIAPSDSPYSASTPIRAWVRQRRSDTPVGPVCVDGTQAHRRRVAWENGIERGVCRLCGDVKIYHQEVEANVWH